MFLMVALYSEKVKGGSFSAISNFRLNLVS